MILFWVFFVLFIVFMYYVIENLGDNFAAVFVCAFAYVVIVFLIICWRIPTKMEEVKVPIQIVERPDAIYVFADKYSFPYTGFEQVKYLQTMPDSAILINHYNTYGIIIHNKLKFYK